MKKSILLVALTLLFGCTSVAVKNTREAKLMPEKVAKEVLGKYLGYDWAANPTGKALGMYCGRDDYPLPFNAIKQVLYIHVGSASTLDIRTFHGMALGFTCGSEIDKKIVKNNPPFSEDELDDITDALVSLGAQIKEIEYK